MAAIWISDKLCLAIFGLYAISILRIIWPSVSEEEVKDRFSR